MSIIVLGADLLKKETFAYMRIYQELHNEIESGALKPGSRLPTESELKEQYSVSRDTIRRALTKLETEGYICRKAAAGTFVRIRKTDYSLSNHESFSEQMRAMGLMPSSDIRSIQISSEFPAEIVSQLQVEPEEKIYKICRLRKANGEPMAYEVVYIPLKLCPNLHTHIFEDTSLYELYENEYGLKMGNISVSIEADTAKGESQHILRIANNTPILKVTSLMRLEDGRPLYYVICEHIGGKYIFSAILPRKRSI